MIKYENYSNAKLYYFKKNYLSIKKKKWYKGKNWDVLIS